LALAMLALTGCGSPVPLKAGGSRLAGYWTAEKEMCVAWPVWPLFGLPEVLSVGSPEDAAIAFRDDGSLDTANTSMGLPVTDSSRFLRQGDKSSLGGEQWSTNISYELTEASYTPGSTALTMRLAADDGTTLGRVNLVARAHGSDHLKIRYVVERPIGLPCIYETLYVMKKDTLPSTTQPASNERQSNWSFQFWIGKPPPPAKDKNAR